MPSREAVLEMAVKVLYLHVSGRAYSYKLSEFLVIVYLICLGMGFLMSHGESKLQGHVSIHMEGLDDTARHKERLKAAHD